MPLKAPVYLVAQVDLAAHLDSVHKEPSSAGPVHSFSKYFRGQGLLPARAWCWGGVAGVPMLAELGPLLQPGSLTCQMETTVGDLEAVPGKDSH